MKDKVIIFNGPPRSGKDTFADMLDLEYGITDDGLYFYRDSFKDELLRLVRNYYQIRLIEWDNRYDTQKEEPWDKLGGLSQREALIDMSENKIKPVLGKDYFGKAAAEGLLCDEEDDDTNVAVFSDGGFKEEIVPIIEKVGAENVLIIRLHRDGCDFSNDSRGYLEIPEVKTVDVESKAIDTTFDGIKKLVDEWVRK